MSHGGGRRLHAASPIAMGGGTVGCGLEAASSLQRVGEDRIFTSLFKARGQFFTGRISPKVNFPGQNHPQISYVRVLITDCEI